ncbi:hypothetical protein CRUP_033546, partial [Coryphaenoides rupestris]
MARALLWKYAQLLLLLLLLCAQPAGSMRGVRQPDFFSSDLRKNIPHPRPRAGSNKCDQHWATISNWTCEYIPMNKLLSRRSSLFVSKASPAKTSMGFVPSGHLLFCR